jgi:hypothetical protein
MYNVNNIVKDLGFGLLFRFKFKVQGYMLELNFKVKVCG